MPDMGLGRLSNNFTLPTSPFLTLSYRLIEHFFCYSRLTKAGADNVKFPVPKCLRKWKVQKKALKT